MTIEYTASSLDAVADWIANRGREIKDAAARQTTQRERTRREGEAHAHEMIADMLRATKLTGDTGEALAICRLVVGGARTALAEQDMMTRAQRFIERNTKGV